MDTVPQGVIYTAESGTPFSAEYDKVLRNAQTAQVKPLPEPLPEPFAVTVARPAALPVMSPVTVGRLNTGTFKMLPFDPVLSPAAPSGTEPLQPASRRRVTCRSWHSSVPSCPGVPTRTPR